MAMMMRRVKTIMTTWKCKQCALYLEAQGLLGRAMTSRSEDMMMIVMMVRTFKSFHLVDASSWVRPSVHRNVIEKEKAEEKNWQHCRTVEKRGEEERTYGEGGWALKQMFCIFGEGQGMGPCVCRNLATTSWNSCFEIPPMWWARWFCTMTVLYNDPPSSSKKRHRFLRTAAKV